MPVRGESSVDFVNAMTQTFTAAALIVGAAAVAAIVTLRRHRHNR
ncbi:hypothetical protein [Sphaerisporangium sp. NPDC051011]